MAASPSSPREAVARVGHVSVVSAAVCRGGAVEAAGVLRPVVYESGPNTADGA